MDRVSRSITHTILGIGALASATAMAQQSYTDESKDSAAPLLEEIIVTADRKDSFGADLVQAGTFRGARTLDTPLTVDVVTRDLIDAQQSLSMLDALKNTSGVTASQLNNALYSNLAIRGIAIDNRGNYRLDGSLPILNYVDLPLEDKDRVEALKGVSALYYGFASPSGIVNLVFKRPPQGPLLAATGFGNSHGAGGGHLDAGDSFLDGKVGVRTNLVYSTSEIGVDNTSGFRELESLAFDIKPTDKLTLSLDGEWIRKKATEPATYFVAAPKNGVVTLPPLPDPTRNLGAEWMKGDGREANGLASLTYRPFQNWELLLQAGKSDLNRDRLYSQFQNYNLTSGAGTLLLYLTNGNWYHNNNYRAEISGGFMTGPFRHQLSIGADENQRVGEVTSNPTIPFAQNLYNPVAIPFTPMAVRKVINHSDINDAGVYGFDRVDFTPWLEGLGGVRYSNYSDLNSNTHIDQHDRQTSPSAGLIAKPVDNLSIYGTYIEGLEEGGTAPGGSTNQGLVLAPSVTKQYEAGVKYQWERLLLTSAYFHLNRPSYYLNLANTFVQDGRTTYQGAEFSASGEITDQWSVYSTMTYLDAKQGNTAGGLQNGFRPENTPEFTASVFFEYRVPVLAGLSVNAGVFHTGNRAINNANTAFIGSYTTGDVGARYRTSLWGSQTSLNLYVENVTGERYWAATGASLLNPNLPRTARFSITTQL